MGIFSDPINLIGATGTESETLTGLVDTGATFTSAPTPTLERLGVIPQRRIRLKLANGEIMEQDVGEVLAEIDGVKATVICVFNAEDAQPLIGAHTLEAFLLTVDPIEQKLVPTDALWL
ncbi:MAG: hypothetical protein IH962_01320 [Chloroflexi bacterium]|nr:hypothetical protein [Chloroflexota bacterium]